MPKDTFYNLPEEKRDLVLRCSYEEFASHDFRNASLSRIVDNAGIAKGSVYQYFENKVDLYRHLISVAAEKKLAYLSEFAGIACGDFFRRFRGIVFRSLQFNLENPLLSHLLYLAAREAPTSEIAPVTEAVHRDAQAFVRRLLEDGLAAGEIRVGLDLELAAYLISEMSIRLEDFIEERFSFSYAEVLAQRRDRLPVPRDRLEEVADSFMQLIRLGVQSG